jgi:hypothetical protein
MRLDHPMWGATPWPVALASTFIPGPSPERGKGASRPHPPIDDPPPRWPIDVLTPLLTEVEAQARGHGEAAQTLGSSVPPAWVFGPRISAGQKQEQPSGYPGEDDGHGVAVFPDELDAEGLEGATPIPPSIA